MNVVGVDAPAPVPFGEPGERRSHTAGGAGVTEVGGLDLGAHGVGHDRRDRIVHLRHEQRQHVVGVGAPLLAVAPTQLRQRRCRRSRQLSTGHVLLSSTAAGFSMSAVGGLEASSLALLRTSAIGRGSRRRSQKTAGKSHFRWSSSPADLSSRWSRCRGALATSLETCCTAAGFRPGPSTRRG